VKPKTWSHPKFAMLKRKLSIPTATAAGILEGIWHLTASFYEDTGEVPYDGDELAAWLELDIDGNTLVSQLVACKWLDDRGGRLFVHDWEDHKPEYLKARIRAKQSRTNTKSCAPVRTVAHESAPSASASASVCNTDIATNVAISDAPSGSPPTNGKPSTKSEFGFPVRGGKTWYLPLKKLEEYRDTYRESLDVDAEFRKAREWLRDNSSRRKTATGMPKFLTSWLNRACDRAPPPTDQSRQASLSNVLSRMKERTGEH
jgi:hypothetical protein